MRLITICIIFTALAATQPSLGAGGGGGAGGAGGDEDQAASADPDFNAGVAAVNAKAWPQVIEHMAAVLQRDATNADAWNYRGFALRQLGDMDSSFKSYEKALSLNPKHRGAHEYMGEAYLLVGNLAQAEQHLKALDKLCFLPCEQYSELKEKIEAYKQVHPVRAGL